MLGILGDETTQRCKKVAINANDNMKLNIVWGRQAKPIGLWPHAYESLPKMHPGSVAHCHGCLLDPWKWS